MEKELFDMVYGWGKFGVVVDESAPAFQATIKKLKQETVRELVDTAVKIVQENRSRGGIIKALKEL